MEDLVNEIIKVKQQIWEKILRVLFEKNCDKRGNEEELN